MDLVVFEYDQRYVLENFCRGDFDFVDGVSEVAETEFFRYIGAHRILPKMAETYPSPREKEEVPLWLFLASNLSMRLHGVHSFHAYPYVVRCGGMLSAFGPEVAHKAKHPATGEVTLSCSGFNDKNTYDRQTPCDQDYLRKFARDTEPEQLQRWFNRDVMRVLKQHRAFDPEGIFLGDASYLFVPDNPNYEGSKRMLFDEHNHPVDSKAISAEQKARCQWKRCYKLVSLVHTNRAGDYFLFAALSVVAGNAHEGPVLWGLVDEFVEAVGPRVMKRLILDRGFIDGAQMGRCKKQHGIEMLIPLKKIMDVYEDVMGLVRGGKVQFKTYTAPPPKPPVEGKPAHVPREIRRREEERYRQLKCFIDLTHFHSRAFALVCNQVLFVALAYSLMQLYLLRVKRSELNRRTQPQTRNQLMPTDSVIIIYYNNHFALLSPMQYTELLLTLSGEAGKKILEKIRRLRRELDQELKLVRAP